MKYQCIIFDCDGVLVDSEPISAKVFAGIMNDLGIDITWEVVFKNLKGGSMEKSIAFVEKQLGSPSPIDIEKIYRERTKIAYQKDMKPIEGIEQVLRNLTIPFCVGSNGPQSKIKLNLELSKLEHFFKDEHIFSAYDIEEWKPKPGLFLHAAKQMNIDPSLCAVIEDSTNGALAAKTAGIDCFGYARDTEEHLFTTHGANPFHDMNELLALLKNQK